MAESGLTKCGDLQPRWPIPQQATSPARFLRFQVSVLCRIEARRQKNRMVLRLAGRLTEAEVPELLEMFAVADEPPLLELDDLVSADAVGVDALLRMELRGAQLIGLPEYLRLKLDDLVRERHR